MTDDERSRIGEQLLGVTFGLRPDDGPQGQAWTLGLAATVGARAIMAAVGPKGDPAPLLTLLTEQIAQTVAQKQSDFIRNGLTKGLSQ